MEDEACRMEDLEMNTQLWAEWKVSHFHSEQIAWKDDYIGILKKELVTVVRENSWNISKFNWRKLHLI